MMHYMYHMNKYFKYEGGLNMIETDALTRLFTIEKIIRISRFLSLTSYAFVYLFGSF